MNNKSTIAAAASLIRARLNAIGYHTSTNFGGEIESLIWDTLSHLQASHGQEITLEAPPVPAAPEQEESIIVVAHETPEMSGNEICFAPQNDEAPTKPSPRLRPMALPKAERVPFGILAPAKAPQKKAI